MLTRRRVWNIKVFDMKIRTAWKTLKNAFSMQLQRISIVDFKNVHLKRFHAHNTESYVFPRREDEEATKNNKKMFGAWKFLSLLIRMNHNKALKPILEGENYNVNISLDFHNSPIEYGKVNVAQLVVLERSVKCDAVIILHVIPHTLKSRN